MKICVYYNACCKEQLQNRKCDGTLKKDVISISNENQKDNGRCERIRYTRNKEVYIYQNKD